MNILDLVYFVAGIGLTGLLYVISEKKRANSDQTQRMEARSAYADRLATRLLKPDEDEPLPTRSRIQHLLTGEYQSRKPDSAPADDDDIDAVLRSVAVKIVGQEFAPAEARRAKSEHVLGLLEGRASAVDPRNAAEELGHWTDGISVATVIGCLCAVSAVVSWWAGSASVVAITAANVSAAWMSVTYVLPLYVDDRKDPRMYVFHATAAISLTALHILLLFLASVDHRATSPEGLLTTPDAYFVVGLMVLQRLVAWSFPFHKGYQEWRLGRVLR